MSIILVPAVAPRLPRGYRRTEIGNIPEAWFVKPLSDTGTLSSGTTPSRALFDRYYKDGVHFWVKTLDLNNSTIRSTDERVTAAALSETCLRLYPPGTVLIAMYGGFRQIGRTGLLAVYAATNQAISSFLPNLRQINSQFLQAFLNYRVSYWRSVASSSRKDPNITSRDIANFPVAVPPLPEQLAIAEALADVDALIAAQQKLIAKKRAIKTATMQRLLTGKQRLPGFGEAKNYKQTEIGLIPEDWSLRTLGDICNFENGDRSSNYPSPNSFVANGLPFINAGHIAHGKIARAGMDYITPESFIRLGGGKIKSGDLLFCLRGSLGKYGVVTEDFGDGAIASSLIIVRPKSASVDREFLATYFSGELCKRMIDTWAGGAAQPNLGGQDLSRFSIVLPSIPEQQAIAQVLTDMDGEITALEKRLAKTKDIKQGMMQELLTGRTRLV